MKALGNKRGSAMLLAAFLLIPALILSSMVLDMGAAYIGASQLQTAVDAAALAGGDLLPVSAVDTAAQLAATSAAEEYLNKNYNGPADYNVRLDGLQDGVYTRLEVEAGIRQPAYFGGIVGIREIPVSRAAAVETAVCVALNDVVPLSVSLTSLEAHIAAGMTEHITLKYGGGDGTGGSYGAIDLDGVKGGGANDYQDWLLNGFDGLLRVSDQLYPVESGNMAGPTSSAINSRYNACSHFADDGGCTLEHFVPYCQRVLKVPVVEYTGRKYVKVSGFAAFVLESTDPGASSGTVKGSYIDMVTVGSAYADHTGTASGFGVYSLVLIR